MAWVYILSLGSRTETQLTHSPSFDGWPTWCGNKHVIFSSERLDPQQLFIIATDETGLSQLSDNDEANARSNIRGNLMLYNGAKDGSMQIYLRELESISIESRDGNK